MSKTWYPVIDVEKCIECGICIANCPHGVYKKNTSSPIVVQEENCVQGCKFCGKNCPVGAIKYVGDKNVVSSDCGCGCSGGCGCGGKC